MPKVPALLLHSPLVPPKIRAQVPEAEFWASLAQAVEKDEPLDLRGRRVELRKPVKLKRGQSLCAPGGDG